MVGRLAAATTRHAGCRSSTGLLARDAQGNVNSNARKLGIQQILFADRCWNSDGDRGIASWYAMRQCGIGHHDHVHLDLTINGANGNVSYWGAAPKSTAKLDTQVLLGPELRLAPGGVVVEPGRRPTRRDWPCRPGTTRSSSATGTATALEDEIFLWDIHTGSWALQNWNDGDSLNARSADGRRSTTRSSSATGTRDGRFNDMIFWDRDSWYYVVHRGRATTPPTAARGWSPV